MNASASISHPEAAPETLFAYFAGALPEEQAIALEEHFADCDACAEAASRAHEVYLLLDGWTLAAHRRAVRLYELEQALAAAGLDLSLDALRDRVERLAGVLRSGVLVLVDASGGATQLLLEHLAALLGPAAPAAFAPPPSVAIRSRGAVRTRGEKAPSEAAGSPTASAVEASGPAAVRIDLAEKMLSVRTEGGEQMSTPAVVVTRLDADETQTVPPRPGSGATTVQFNVPPGLYLAGAKK